MISLTIIIKTVILGSFRWLKMRNSEDDAVLMAVESPFLAFGIFQLLYPWKTNAKSAILCLSCLHHFSTCVERWQVTWFTTVKLMPLFHTSDVQMNDMFPKMVTCMSWLGSSSTSGKLKPIDVNKATTGAINKNWPKSGPAIVWQARSLSLYSPVCVGGCECDVCGCGWVINPRCACAARVTVLGLCVCVSVSTYSRPTRTKPAHQQYQRLEKLWGNFA